MKNIMRSALDTKMGATKKAFERVRAGVGQETYRPYEIYTQLKPQDFELLANRYGMNNTIRYIQAMENIRLGRRK